jgi:hypothetical protein
MPHMKQTKFYAPKEINLHLLPDLMEKAASSVPPAMLVTEDGTELLLDRYFRLKTISQVASTRDPQEFRDILRTIDEPPLNVEADVDCFPKAKHLRAFEQQPAALSFKFDKERIEISIARNTADAIKTLFHSFEETFALVTVKPPAQADGSVPPRRAVFLAHSFDDRGKSYAYEVIKLLNLLGFEVTTGEGYSPQGISAKVKKRLLAQEVVIAVLSKQEDSTWLTQESAGAIFTGKPLVLLIEEGVTFKPGILGDLEYVRFASGQISMAFVPLLEGLQELGYKVR